jgi:hypothetical protein
VVLVNTLYQGEVRLSTHLKHTHYIFPEERRRMHLLADLLYSHYQLRGRYAALLSHVPPEVAAAHPPLPPDFRREWDVKELVSE